MFSTVQNIRIGISLVMAIGLLSGCDGGSTSPAPAPTPTPTPPPVDRTPPTAPAKVTVDSYSHNQVALSWTAGTDDTGVVKYAIIRSDKPDADLTTVPGLAFTDATASPISDYAYQVVAIDAAGNRSEPSPAVEATTTPTPTATCPETTTTYPGEGGTGLPVGFRGDEAALKVIGPGNLPAGTSWDGRNLQVSGKNVHLTDVIIRGGILVSGEGVFTLTNSVVELISESNNINCYGDETRPAGRRVSECRLTGNTIRRAHSMRGESLISATGYGNLIARCNYLVDTSMFASAAAKSVFDYNRVDGGYIGGSRSNIAIAHNRANQLISSSDSGLGRIEVDGNLLGGRSVIGVSTHMLRLFEATPIFRNNVIAPSDKLLCLIPKNPPATPYVDTSNNFLGDSLGNRTATPFRFPEDCDRGD